MGERVGTGGEGGESEGEREGRGWEEGGERERREGEERGEREEEGGKRGGRGRGGRTTEVNSVSMAMVTFYCYSYHITTIACVHVISA